MGTLFGYANKQLMGLIKFYGPLGKGIWKNKGYLTPVLALFKLSWWNPECEFKLTCLRPANHFKPESEVLYWLLIQQHYLIAELPVSQQRMLCVPIVGRNAITLWPSDFPNCWTKCTENQNKPSEISLHTVSDDNWDDVYIDNCSSTRVRLLP